FLQREDGCHLAGSKVEELNQWLVGRFSCDEINPSLDHCPLPPITCALRIEHERLFAARCWHAPDASQSTPFRIVEKFSVWPFHPVEATLLSNLPGLSASRRHLPKLLAAAAV